jgi:protein-S-isoprenylcysteine O-methyltransferase Ste14
VVTTTINAGPRTKLLSAGYAGLSYAFFVGVFGYAVAFIAGVGVPRSVDAGGSHSDTAAAVLVDGLLLGLFAVQHSVMARPAFKRRWTRIVPKHIERSTYVLAASAVLTLIFWQWRPIPGLVWRVESGPARVVLWGLFAAGWLLVLAMTFAIDHLGMFGLRQVASWLRGVAEAPSRFRTPLPYRLVRHPMMTAFFVALLAAPTMTAGHLLFSVLSCGYIVAAVRLEERDLAAELPDYPSYAATTPRFVPRPRKGAL